MFLPLSLGRTGAVLVLSVALPAAAQSTSVKPLELNVSASLAQPGWIPPSGRQAPVTDTSDSFGGIASDPTAEWWYTERYPDGTSNSFQLAGAYARADKTGDGTPSAVVAFGASAHARAIATAAGGATASTRAVFEVNVVINPFANAGAFGMPLYQQLVQRFGCDPQGQCSKVEMATTFQHVSTGRFAHSVQPFHQGRATFSESLQINGVVDVVTLAGSAQYDVVQPPAGSNQLAGVVSTSGGWAAGDFTPFAARSATTLSLYPSGDPMNANEDPNGRLGGSALLALRQASVTGQFAFVELPELNALPLPLATYQITLEQTATAGFAGGYGWGTVAADFDNTAMTSVLALIDPTGELALDPSVLQVFMTPVPEPSPLTLSTLGLAMLGLGLRRLRRRDGPRSE